MKRLYTIIPIIIVFLCVFAACAIPPIGNMKRARDAVLQAENDENAVNYASATLLQARNFLARMQAEADARRYDEARKLAALAITYAEVAIIRGERRVRAEEIRVRELRERAERIIRNEEDLIARILNDINNARLVPNTQIDFDEISRTMNFVQLLLNLHRQNFEAGNYQDVITSDGMFGGASRVIDSIDVTLGKDPKDPWGRQ